MPSVCNDPVTGSQALGSSHRLGQCGLLWTALPSLGIGSVAVLLILLHLLMVDSDDFNVVTLLIQPPSMQSHSGDNMVQTYSRILHSVRTLYGQMAEGEFARSYMHPDDRYISMLRQCPSVAPAVHLIAPLAVLPIYDDIFFLFTRISQGSELSDR